MRYKVNAILLALLLASLAALWILHSPVAEGSEAGVTESGTSVEIPAG